MPKRKLTGEMKRFVVMALAADEPPSSVAAELHEKFGVKVTRQAIEAYHPYREASRSSGRWKKLFDESVDAHKAMLDDIPIVHRVYRLKLLQRLVHSAQREGNVLLAVRMLAHAAKEVGDFYVRGPRR